MTVIDAETAQRVMVVDDDTVSRMVLSHMLRRSGYAVTEAADIGPAIELMAVADFAVIFSDFQMPGGTGLDLLAALPTRRRPLFVLVTGIVEYASPGVGPDGVDARLTKPISSRALACTLAAILGPREQR